MILLAGRTEIELKDITTYVTVPDNNRAILMYYLHCICIVLKIYDPEIICLTQYNNHRLIDEQTDALIALYYLLSPDVLLDKCIFHSEELCGEMTNK